MAALAAGCGEREPRTVPPLDPPRPEVDGLVLEHTSGRLEGERFVPAWEYRLELEPAGRFRYTWHRVDDDEWRDIRGTWRASEREKNAWTLEPDAGEDALEPGEFVAGQRPTLEWSGSLQPAGASPGSSGFGAMWMIPALDPATGRFLHGFTLQQDARMGAHLQKFLEEGR